MIFIFVGSYLNVPCAISIISKAREEFRVLSSNQMVLDFFSDFYSAETVINVPSFFLSFSNPRRFIEDLYFCFTRRGRFLKELQALSPEKVYYFYLGWNGFEYWLIQRLSSSARVCYHPKLVLSGVKESKSRRLQLKSALLRILFGIPCRPIKFYHYEFLSVSERFLEMTGGQIGQPLNDEEVVRAEVNRKYNNLPETKVLLLVGREHNMDMEEHNRKWREVFAAVMEFFSPAEVAFKHHPNFTIDGLDVPDGVIDLPSTLPANLACYKSDIVVAYASATLFEAANIGKHAIALTRMIDSTHPEQVEGCRQYLLDNAKKSISFPRDLNELKEELAELSKEKECC